MKEFVSIFISALILSTFFSCRNNTNVNNFKLSDTAEITKISILQNNDSTVLERNAGGWKVNKKYNALPEAVEYIFTLALNADIQNIAEKSKNSDQIKLILKNNKQIIFYKEKKQIKKWFVGKFDTKLNATPAFTDQTQKAVWIVVPGITPDLDKNIPAEKFLWIKSKIFEYSPDQITEISVEYPQDKQNSFKISFKNNLPELFINGQKYKSEKINLTAVGAYLSYFTSVKYSSFIQDTTTFQKDSVKNSDSFFKITIKDRQGNSNTLQAYYLYNNSNIKNQNSYIGIINSSEFVKVMFFDTDLLMKKPEYFIIN